MSTGEAVTLYPLLLLGFGHPWVFLSRHGVLKTSHFGRHRHRLRITTKVKDHLHGSGRAIFREYRDGQAIAAYREPSNEAGCRQWTMKMKHCFVIKDIAEVNALWASRMNVGNQLASGVCPSHGYPRSKRWEKLPVTIGRLLNHVELSPALTRNAVSIVRNVEMVPNRPRVNLDAVSIGCHTRHRRPTRHSGSDTFFRVWRVKIDPKLRAAEPLQHFWEYAAGISDKVHRNSVVPRPPLTKSPHKALRGPSVPFSPPYPSISGGLSPVTGA